MTPPPGVSDAEMIVWFINEGSSYIMGFSFENGKNCSYILKFLRELKICLIFHSLLILFLVSCGYFAPEHDTSTEYWKCNEFEIVQPRNVP